MATGDTNDAKQNHVSLRVDHATLEYIDRVGEEWDIRRDDGEVNRSEVLRLIISTHQGIMLGNFFGIVDTDALAREWGETGHLLAAAYEADRDLPEGLSDPCLADVLEPVPILVRAAEVEHGDTELEPSDAPTH